MSDIALFASNHAVQMTSKDIAGLVEKRHSNVKRTIDTLSENGVISKPQIEFLDEISNLGLPIKREVYVFSGEQGKRDSIVVVAQLSPEFTARLVDRWQELEAQVKGLTTPVRPASLRSEATDLLESELRAASLLEVPKHLAQVEAVKIVRLETGVDFAHLLLVAPAQSQIEPQDEYLEPAELALRFGIHADRSVSQRGAAVNQWLESCGLQYKANGIWHLTEKGKPHAIRHQWTVGNRSGYNWKWSVQHLESLLAQVNWPIPSRI